MSDSDVPAALREQIAATLRPVKPLSSPRRRALALLPMCVALLLVAPVVFGLRADLARLGTVRLLVGSLIQVGVALLLCEVALQESIPGRVSSRSRIAVLLLIGFACVAALTYSTYAISPTHSPSTKEVRHFFVCLRRALLLGSVPFAVISYQLRRGVVPFPLGAGLLAGMTAGLAADAGLRLYCEVSAPGHVFAAHAGAIVILSDAGGIAALWPIGRPARRN